MLPQKSIIKPLPKSTGSSSEQDSHEAGGQSATLGNSQAPATSLRAQNRFATMPPPSKLLPLASTQLPAGFEPASLKQDSAKIGHLRSQHSTSRKSSRDNGAHPSRDFGNSQNRTSSERSNPQSNAKEFGHGRPLSQQVKPTATSDRLFSSAFHQRQSSMKHPRPAFSAMQQHFSPKQSIQPDPSTVSSQPVGKDETPSADIFNLQMELAQLHLLHRSVFSVQVQWKQSAKGSFEHRFNSLYERHTELKDVARQQQTLINQLSLVQWAQGRSGAQITEKAQLLSHNVSDICSLLSSEGKYSRILGIFESWFAEALRIRGQRETCGRETRRDLDFIEGIGDGWKAEAMVLERELTYSARDLESFGEVQDTSSLCRLMSMYRKLMVGLLEELDLIQWIENEIMTQETLWIENTIHNLASDVRENIGSMGPERKAF